MFSPMPGHPSGLTHAPRAVAALSHRPLLHTMMSFASAASPSSFPDARPTVYGASVAAARFHRGEFLFQCSSPRNCSLACCSRISSRRPASQPSTARAGFFLSPL